MVTKTFSAESEIGRLIREAEATGEPLRLAIDGTTYVVVKTSTDAATVRPSSYDPQRARAAIEAGIGAWSDVDAEELKRYLYEGREAGSRGPDRP